jgi:nitrogenase molybdenum-iron protein NifN
MNKNLTINPNRMSQPAGAALALMGVKGMIPLWHGVQGCTAFAKVLFISHFREPMPFQTTAIGQTNIVMGSDQNIVEALTNLQDQSEIVGIITTGVAETSGVNLQATLKLYREDNPGAMFIYLNTPDYEGNLASGYAKAAETLLTSLVSTKTKIDSRQVAVFPGPYVTPGEIETLRTIIEDFGLHPLFCPDLGDSLYGYLQEKRFSPCSSGGIEIGDLKKLSDSAIVLSVGSTMESLAYRFGKIHEIPVLHYNNLGVLQEIDHFFQTLEWISATPTPEQYKRQRQHYLDTLLDTDFFFHGKRVAIAGDPEFVKRWKAPLDMLEVVTIGITNQSVPGLEEGDCSDFSKAVIDLKVDFLVGNSHVARIADELKIPVIRSGIPVTDRFGEPQSVRIGYAGAARQLMECANAVLQISHHPRPYVSPLQETLT